MNTPEALAPVGRSFSPWWGLLLFPLALLVGWLAGRMPAPEAAVHRAVASGPGASSPAGESRPEWQAAGLSQWTTLENATAESRRSGKPVLLDFNAAWCGPCQALKREVFEDEALGRLIQSAVIPVSIVDRVREDGSNPPEVQSLQERFNVEAFPTLIVYSPATGRALSARGFGDAEATVTWIARAARWVR